MRDRFLALDSPTVSCIIYPRYVQTCSCDPERLFEWNTILTAYRLVNRCWCPFNVEIIGSARSSPTFFIRNIFLVKEQTSLEVFFKLYAIGG
jgi:hypothetical protein